MENNNTQSFAEGICNLLQEKKIEIYVGTTSENRAYADYSQDVKEIIVGTIKKASGSILVVEIENEGKKNLVYLNDFYIISVVEPKPGICTYDMFDDIHKKHRK